jgi:hypothetical protein
MVEEVNDFILKNDFNNAKLQDTKNDTTQS